MNVKAQKPNLRSEKIQSASFLLWIISGLYLLTMVWFLLRLRWADTAHPKLNRGSCQQLS